MKKILGSILSVIAVTGLTSFADIGEMDKENSDFTNNIIHELNSLQFKNTDTSLEGYLINDKKLVVIIEYSHEEHNKVLSSNYKEEPKDILNIMEHVTLSELCSSNKIADLINSNEYTVNVDYLLNNGEKYMARTFSQC